MDLILIMMVLAVGAMFFLSSRTRKQQREANAFRSSLEVGDQVMTGSGLFGTVVEVDGDVITLESPAGGRTDWLRGAIGKLATPPYAEYEDEDVEDDDAAEDMAEDMADDVDAELEEVEYLSDDEYLEDAEDLETLTEEDVAVAEVQDEPDASDVSAASPEDTRRP